MSRARRAARVVRRVGVGGIDWLRAMAQRVRAVVDRTPPDAFLAPPPDGRCGEVPVVILPGVLEPWRFLLKLERSLYGRGHPVHVVPSLGWNVLDLDESRRRVLDHLERRDLTGVVLVAHSKGGLIGKALLLDPEATGRLRGLVAVCAPWQGSSLVPRWAERSPVGMFRPDFEGMLALEAQDHENHRIVSLAPAFDQVLPEGSHLAGARNVRLRSDGHFAPTRNVTSLAMIHRCVDDLANRPSG